jgi:hypothetical protein
MKGGIGNILKQAQTVQENIKKAQAELAEIEVQGNAGGGMVRVTMTCRYDVRRIEIDQSLMGDDREVLEDLVAAAVNDAVRKAEHATQEKMAHLATGFGIPGLNLPF